MMDKQFEMQSEKPGPAIAHRLNPENDYRPERLADLLSGDDLKSAIGWYEIALYAPGTTKAQAFIRSIQSMFYEKEKAVPSTKTRLFSAPLKNAIAFFSGAQIPIEHVTMWGKGIDPYLGNPADLDDF